MGKWSVKDTLSLIELFKTHPSLWDQSSREYRIKRKKQKDLRFIANSMNVDKSVIEKKWKSLRTIYKSELNKINASRRSGKQYVSPWRYFGYLRFLYGNRNQSEESTLKIESGESDYNESIVDTNLEGDTGNVENDQLSGDDKKSEVESTKWSEKRIIELIQYFEKYPLLWNPNDKEFKINYKKDEALLKISKLMGMPKEDIKKKWRILRTQFKSELNKMRKSKSIDDLYVSDWRYLRPMKFLYDSGNEDANNEYHYIFDEANDFTDDENADQTLSNCDLEKGDVGDFSISTYEVKQKWSPQAIYQLIQQFKAHPSLWDKSVKECRIKSVRENDLRQVAENMGMEKSEIERKWKSLRTHYCAELRKMKEGRANGNRVYISNWRFLSSMKFLYDSYKEDETNRTEISFPSESNDSMMEITVVQTSQDEEYEDTKGNPLDTEDVDQILKRRNENTREENDSTVTKLRKVEQCYENNECDIFCSLMATKLRKLSSNLRDEAMRKLMRVMWDFEDAQKQCSNPPSPCNSFENI